MRSGIYRITLRRPDGSAKYYIGQSAYLRRRENDHFQRLRLKKHYNKALQLDVDECGIDAARFDVLLICEPDRKILNMYEQLVLDGYDPETVYNVRLECVISPLGTTPSAESNAKRAASMRGKKRTPEEVRKSAMARTGQKRSAESKQRMALARIGRKLSATHKANIGLATSRRARPPEVPTAP